MQLDKDRKTQRRYEGFIATPNLWKDDVVKGIHQFNLLRPTPKIDAEILDHLRLGKYIEQFVFYMLQQDTNISRLHKNIQIQKEKQTLGEIDCLFVKGGVPIHLEISYKFYLVDFNRGDHEIDFCIGPNNRDSLVEKLIRIEQHQLPLLFKNETREILRQINFNPSECEQKVLFRCQLFLPLEHRDYRFKILNNKCICGFYIPYHRLSTFSNSKFFIPNKKDWLLAPHTDVSWLSYTSARSKIKEYHEKKFSPLCWIKKPNGQINKVFVLWWS